MLQTLLYCLECSIQPCERLLMCTLFEFSLQLTTEKSDSNVAIPKYTKARLPQSQRRSLKRFPDSFHDDSKSAKRSRLSRLEENYWCIQFDFSSIPSTYSSVSEAAMITSFPFRKAKGDLNVRLNRSLGHIQSPSVQIVSKTWSVSYVCAVLHFEPAVESLAVNRHALAWFS